MEKEIIAFVYTCIQLHSTYWSARGKFIFTNSYSLQIHTRTCSYIMRMAVELHKQSIVACLLCSKIKCTAFFHRILFRTSPSLSALHFDPPKAVVTLKVQFIFQRREGRRCSRGRVSPRGTWFFLLVSSAPPPPPPFPGSWWGFSTRVIRPRNFPRGSCLRGGKGISRPENESDDIYSWFWKETSH